MNDLKISDIMDMQTMLWKKHERKWDPMEAEYARNSLLWMMEEVGEVIAIIKKKGDNAILHNEVVRESFLEEMSDVIMYLADTLLRYKVGYEEISEAFIRKYEHNMGRNFKQENDKFLSGDKNG